MEVPKTIDCKLEHSSKALEPICTNELGKSNLVTPVLAKAPSSIFCKPFPKESDLRFEQFANASFLISVKELGNERDVIDVLAKALSPINFNELPNVTD